LGADSFAEGEKKKGSEENEVGGGTQGDRGQAGAEAVEKGEEKSGSGTGYQECGGSGLGRQDRGKKKAGQGEERWCGKGADE
jgi:hypothetical protein